MGCKEEGARGHGCLGDDSPAAQLVKPEARTLGIDGVGGDWIVKLPSPRFEAVPENEFAMMTLARAVGIDVPDVQLVKRPRRFATGGPRTNRSAPYPIAYGRPSSGT